MESKNKTRASNSRNEANGEVQLHPELLMAAREGKSKLLNNLLNKEDEVIIVHIGVANTAANMCVEKDAQPTEGAVTIGLDSILHVVASSGDGEDFLKSADVIYGWDQHLLDARNKKGDTPLHCATRAGNIEMVTHLIALARGEDGGDARVEEVLRKQNKQGETALHAALGLADKKMVDKMVDVLTMANAKLARFAQTNGTSPLYLAVMLGHDDIAERLYENDKELCYSGPDGQNVLHVAVLRSNEMTAKLLKWNKNLIKQGDKTTGSTPLHIAASWGNKKVIKLLLEADNFSAFRSDNRGSFPIHVAAERMLFSVIRILLKRYPSCAGLQDAEGKTFLHIAVEKERSFVVLYACCCHKRFAPIFNMQDNKGNTPLHLAAKVGNQWCFYFLIQNQQAQLNLQNSEGQTPLDIAWKLKPQGITYGLAPRNRIYLLLEGAGAKNGTYRRDWFVEKLVPKIDEKEEAEKIKDSTQIIGLGSVLIVTVAFAAAFTLPGGFVASDDKSYPGTATLAHNKVFDAFIITNTLALVCSGLATLNVMFAGVSTVDIRTRMSAFLIAIFFLYCSAKSLGAAFVFAMYVVLTPVASTTAYISCAIAAPFLLLDIAWFFFMVAIGEVMVLKRVGCMAWLRALTPYRIPIVIVDLFVLLGTPLPSKADGQVSLPSQIDNKKLG